MTDYYDRKIIVRSFVNTSKTFLWKSPKIEKKKKLKKLIFRFLRLATKLLTALKINRLSNCILPFKFLNTPT
jgi:hypothetical protein